MKRDVITQRPLYTEVQDLFAYAHQTEFRNVKHDFHQTVNSDMRAKRPRATWSEEYLLRVLIG